jgi:hypothetical protein
LRLRAVPDGWVPLFRLAWFLCFILSLSAVAVGVVHAFRETYEVHPAFKALALDYDLDTDGRISIKAESRPHESFHLIAIDEAPLSRDIRAPELARRLASAPGPVVRLDVRGDDGRLEKLQQKRNTAPPDQSASRARDLRFAARMASGLLACGVLLLCSFLLARRRPSDPVALLFAFAFAGVAGTIDPPQAMWMAYGYPLAFDVISSTWFYLLLIALAVFPDGIFVPKPCRWLILAGIPMAIYVSLHDADSNLQAVVAFGSLLGVLAAQIRRYRRLGAGIERQQIKWAAFGFAAGLILVAIAFVIIPFLPDEANPKNLALNVVVVLLFSLGMAVLPLGLLIALTRFRLWEADTVITRSAAYAVVTLVVGIVWAASSDLVKLVIEEVMGQESQAGATTAGAVIAAGIFSPTQSLVLGWTKRHFGSPLERIHEAATRLKTWGLTEPPSELATRALTIIDQAIHPSAAAIELDTAMGPELIAAREVTSVGDPKLVEKLNLIDEETSVGTLLLGRRSDGNRYSKQELEAVREIVPPLAEALRVARGRYSRESMMQQRLDEMAQRLAQLEGGVPKPA